MNPDDMTKEELMAAAYTLLHAYKAKVLLAAATGQTTFTLDLEAFEGLVDYAEGTTRNYEEARDTAEDLLEEYQKLLTRYEETVDLLRSVVT